MRERFDAGTGLVALGAVLLLVSLFVDWFTPGGDAWAIFEWVDVFLAGCALAAFAALSPRYVSVARMLPLIAGAALAVVAVQVIDPPPAARGADRETGVWLALAATALMALGAALSAARVSITVDVRARERRRRTAAIDARDEAPEGGDPARAADSAADDASGRTRGAADEPTPIHAAEPAGATRGAAREQPAPGAGAATTAPTGRTAGAEPGAVRPAGPGGRGPAAPEDSRAPRRGRPFTSADGDDAAEDPERTQILEPLDRRREGS